MNWIRIGDWGMEIKIGNWGHGLGFGSGIGDGVLRNRIEDWIFLRVSGGKKTILRGKDLFRSLLMSVFLCQPEPTSQQC